MDEAALSRVLDRWRQRQGEAEAIGSLAKGSNFAFRETPAPPPMTRQERMASLDEEEALFRVYWRTLTDKALAGRTWPSELRHYCRERDLGPEMLEALERRVREVREERF